MSNPRTTVVKKHETEGYLYGVLHFGDTTGAHKFGVVQTVAITGETSCVSENGDEYSDYSGCCSSVDTYVRTVTANEQGTALIVSIDSTEVTIPAGTPPNRGFLIALGSGTPKDVTGTMTVTSGGYVPSASQPGVILEIVFVPSFVAATDLLSYVTDFNQPGVPEQEIIRDKGKYKHRKLLANIERTASGSGLFTNYTAHMPKFAGQLATFCYEIKDDGGGLVSEKSYFGHCFMGEPSQNRSSGDEKMSYDFEFSYERWMTVAGE